MAVQIKLKASSSREGRDKTLSWPNRMLAALSVDLRGGQLPDPEPDGRNYFKIPTNKF